MMTETQTLAGALIAGIVALFGVLVWVAKAAVPKLLETYRADMATQQVAFFAALKEQRTETEAAMNKLATVISTAVDSNTKATNQLADVLRHSACYATPDQPAPNRRPFVAAGPGF